MIPSISGNGNYKENSILPVGNGEQEDKNPLSEIAMPVLHSPFAVLDLRLKIFSLLSLGKEMASASLVCKLWHQTMKIPKIGLFHLAEIQKLDMKLIQKLCYELAKRSNLNLDYIELIEKCINIEILDLSNSDIDDDFIFQISLLELKKLKVLILRNCSQLLKPSFRGFASLRSIDLTRCNNLESIHLHEANDLETLSLAHTKISDSSLSNLSKVQVQSLEDLDLTGCAEICIPPLSNFSFLRFLNLSGTSIDDKFIAGGHLQELRGLEKLTLNNCLWLVEPHFNFLPLLKEIYLNKCKYLTSPVFENLDSIYSICIQKSQLLEIPHFVDLPTLKLLNLSGNYLTDADLKKILSRSLPGLQDLILEECVHLKAPDLSEMQSLKKIDLCACPDLTYVNLTGLTLLEELILSATSVNDAFIVQFILFGLSSLRILHLNYCHELKNPILTNLSSLHILEMSYGSRLKNPIVKNLPSLRIIRIKNIKQRITPSFEALYQLELLDLSRSTISDEGCKSINPEYTIKF